jgi:hypothetical protein
MTHPCTPPGEGNPIFIARGDPMDHECLLSKLLVAGLVEDRESQFSSAALPESVHAVGMGGNHRSIMKNS